MASGILLFVGLSGEEVALLRQNSTATFTSDIWRQKLQRLLDHQTKVGVDTDGTDATDGLSLATNVYDGAQVKHSCGRPPHF